MLGAFFAFLTALSWAGRSTCMKLIVDRIDILSLNFIRLWVGSAILIVFIPITGRGAQLIQTPVAALLFVLASGIIAMVVGLVKIAKLYRVFGRRSILTFFAISLYPVQAVYLKCDLKVLVGLVVTAAPAILVLEVFAVAMRKKVLKVDPAVPSP